MDLNNGHEVPNLEESLITPHMDGPNLGPIDDEVQEKQLKRENMWNYIKRHHEHDWLQQMN
jgi:hypothetical protein